jgi:hypothetical protein
VVKPVEKFAPAPPRSSIFSTSILPLLGQALVIRKVNPVLSVLVKKLAYYARAVAEETLSAQADPLLKVLGDGVIGPSRMDQLRSSLLDGFLPLNATLFAKGLAEELEISGLASDPEGDAGQALQKALYHANSELFPAGDDFSLAPSSSGYYATASVDRPKIVDAQTYAAVGIVSVTSRFIDTGDDLYATETTYPRVPAILCLEKDDVPENAPIVNPGYRATINSDDPVQGFFENLEPGLNLFLFHFVMTEQNLFPFSTEIKRLLEENEERIKEAIDRLAEDAGEAAKTGATGAGFAPLSKLAEKITSQVVKTGLNKVYEIIVEILGGSSFTPVSIVHLVNWLPGLSPESIFRLEISGRAGDSMIYPVERDLQFPLTRCTVLEENGLPKYPAGGPKLQFLYTSRYMKGASHDPAQPAPADLWRKVAAKKQPAIWTNTEGNEGFHVLVPVAEVGGKGLYVWSFRADLRSALAGIPV